MSRIIFSRFFRICQNDGETGRHFIHFRGQREREFGRSECQRESP